MKKPPAAFAGGGLGSAGSAKSGSSGSFSRAHVVGANSNGGNGNSAAKAGMTIRVGAEKTHDVDSKLNRGIWGESRSETLFGRQVSHRLDSCALNRIRDCWLYKLAGSVNSR